MGNKKFKERLKFLGRFLFSFILCFLVIYIVIFFGGWTAFEHGDPILIELCAATILSVFVFAFMEVSRIHDKKIKALEKRLDELEKKIRIDNDV